MGARVSSGLAEPRAMATAARLSLAKGGAHRRCSQANVDAHSKWISVRRGVGTSHSPNSELACNTARSRVTT